LTFTKETLDFNGKTDAEIINILDEYNIPLAPEEIKIIQNDLFDLGADLCIPDKKNIQKLKITNDRVDYIEEKIDSFNKELAPLNSFVLPGGLKSSTYLHIARTVTRRAERKVVALSKKEKINPVAIIYLNRLSDLLFVLARYTNNKGKKDILWKPGKNLKKK